MTAYTTSLEAVGDLNTSQKTVEVEKEYDELVHTISASGFGFPWVHHALPRPDRRSLRPLPCPLARW